MPGINEAIVFAIEWLQASPRILLMQLNNISGVTVFHKLLPAAHAALSNQLLRNIADAIRRFADSRRDKYFI